MKISTEIGSIAKKVGEEKAVELVARAGFDAWDLSMFRMAQYDWQTKSVIDSGHPFRTNEYVSFVKRLRQIGLDNGIVCNQSHAPFPVRFLEIRDYLKRAIECSAIAGAEICVIHPDNHSSAEKNAEMYQELLPFAKEHGVKIATENMFNWDRGKDQASAAACSHHDDFLAHIKAVNDPSFVACLDIGHAEMRGLDTSAKDMILTLGDHIQALHIHDNDRHHDSHALPFTMNINFDEILTSLKQIGYTGYFTLESDRHLSRLSDDDVEKGVLEMAQATRKLADAYEAL